MILYKYVSFPRGMELLRNRRISFTKPEYFNDPFDKPESPREPPKPGKVDFTEMTRRFVKDAAWRNATGILSLTRTPVNPLMWAHYADSHFGMVVGIDVKRAGLTNTKTNLVPAQFGSMVYVSRRPEAPYITNAERGLVVGETFHFPSAHYEKLQRLFLHKSIYWSYEEEVRVLKCLAGLHRTQRENASGTFDVIPNPGPPARDLYLFNLPTGAISEVYFGFRAGQLHDVESAYVELQVMGGIKVFQCNLDSSALSVSCDEFIPLQEQLSEA